jgi:hypothetical protein
MPIGPKKDTDSTSMDSLKGRRELLTLRSWEDPDQTHWKRERIRCGVPG